MEKENIIKKVCTKCGEEKELSKENFYWRKDKKYFESCCKVCCVLYRKIFYKINKNKIKEYRKEYYKTNRKKVRKRIKNYNINNKILISNKQKFNYDNNRIKYLLQDAKKRASKNDIPFDESLK